MTVLTCIGSNCFGFGVASECGGCARQRGARQSVPGTRPACIGVAGQTQRGAGIVHYEKISVLVIVRIVTRGALKLA